MRVGAIALSLTLVAIAIAVSLQRRLSLEKDLVLAALRALVQLGVLAALVQAVFDDLGLATLLLGTMVVAASWTSSRRLDGVPHARSVAAVSITASSAVALAVLFGTGVFALGPTTLIPIAGMLIGNTMTATSLAGARLRDDLVTGAAEVEARLALGVDPGEALRAHVRRAAVTALVPTIDATKNVGLVLLPGAFVGMILGGASPARAAQVQLIVLFMLLGAVALAAMFATYGVARAFIGTGERLVIPSSLRG